LDNLLREVAEQHGDDPDAWPNHLTHQLVIGGFTERSERGLTGDWLIYAKCEGQNYYLDLATHEEGLQDEADSLFNKLKNGSKAEFPFLFQEET